MGPFSVCFRQMLALIEPLPMVWAGLLPFGAV
jgi:hypothetical protein